MLDFPSSPTNGTIYSGFVYQNGAWMQNSANSVVTAERYNRIVNGAMQHSQENGRVAGATNFYYAADQWLMSIIGITGNTFASVAPTSSADGYLQLSFGTAKPSLAAGDIAAIETRIEGVRMADFRWGTAGALPIVIRFEAFVAAGGTYTVAINNNGASRGYLKSFVLPANQWTTVTLTVPGDTSGTWLVDTGQGMTIDFTFAAGTTFQAAGNAWQAGGKYAVTGISNAAASVQNVFVKNVGLYLDTNNTGLPPPWQAPDFATELAACRRYWQFLQLGWNGAAAAGSNAGGTTVFPVQMRIAPTATANALANVNAGTTIIDQILYHSFRAYASVTATGGYQVNCVSNFNARM